MQPAARWLAMAAWLAASGGTAAAQPAEPTRPYPPWPIHRFDEDWRVLADPARRTGPLDALKHIDLGGPAWLGFGGELRERFEYLSDRNFGIGLPRGAARDNAYLLQRALLHADLHLDPTFRAFLQVGSLASFGARGGTLGATQDDRLDLVQGFADLNLRIADGAALTLRGGRQEFYFGSGRLVSEREGPNLRRAFDGGRAILTLGPLRVDAFLARPVQPFRFAFDDRANPGEALWGAYATGALPGGVPGLRTDLYLLGYERANAVFAQGRGLEQRHTVGTRVAGAAGGWDWDWEAAFQFGTFEGARIRAWTVATDTGHTFAALPWRPRLGLKADIASGDGNPRDRTLGTFNALFPKVPYFTEAGLVAPANLIDVYPSLRAQPTRTVTVELGWDVLWRHRTADAFYLPAPFAPLRGTAGRGGAFAGHQVQLSARWSVTPHVELRGWYVRFIAGDTLRTAGGRDVDFVATSVVFRL